MTLVPVGTIAVILVLLMVVFDIRILGFQFLSYYFIFYTLGYCIHRFSRLRIKNNLIVLTLFFIWAFMAWFWNMHALPSWMPIIPRVPVSLLQYAYRCMTAVVALLVIFAISPRLLNGRNGFNNMFRKIGTISLGIYVVHLILLNYANEFVSFMHLYNTQWLKITFVFIIDLVISTFVVELLKSNIWTAKLLLGKL